MSEAEETPNQLARWGAAHSDRRAIEQFFEFLNETWDGGALEALEAKPLSDLLDQHFEIDRSQLEKERRALFADRDPVNPEGSDG